MQVISIVVGDSRFDIVTFGSLNFSSSDTIVADPSHETNEKQDSLATQPLQSINAIRRYTVLFFLLYTKYRIDPPSSYPSRLISSHFLG